MTKQVSAIIHRLGTWKHSHLNNHHQGITQGIEIDKFLPLRSITPQKVAFASCT